MPVSLYAIGGLLLLLVLSGAGLSYERGQVKTAQAEKVLAVQADQSHQLQIARLEKENKGLAEQSRFKDDVLSTQQDELKDLHTQTQDLQVRYEREKRHVQTTVSSDDGPAAPVLQYTLNSLCGSAQAVAAMSGSDSGKASVSGVQTGSPTDSARASPFCVTISRQSEFASITLDFGKAYQVDAGKLVTIRKVVDAYNSKVRAENGSQK